jgi:hypothetical protein
MCTIHDSTVDTIIRAIQDEHNPMAASRAFEAGLRWAEEADQGLVSISPDALQRLKDALSA